MVWKMTKIIVCNKKTSNNTNLAQFEVNPKIPVYKLGTYLVIYLTFQRKLDS